MHPFDEYVYQSRRDFLATSAGGIGLLALASLLKDDGRLTAAPARGAGPLAPKPPHFAPKAKNCICIYLEGAPSQIDQPVAALIKDLKRRGLLDETLVLWLSEFGRTALGENRKGYAKVTGRDHHPFAFTVWMAGGGVKGGQVYGKTDEIGWNVVENPVHINDLHATILRLFGLDHLKLTYKFQGRDFRLTDVGGKVVTKLMA